MLVSEIPLLLSRMELQSQASTLQHKISLSPIGSSFPSANRQQAQLQFTNRLTLLTIFPDTGNGSAYDSSSLRQCRKSSILSEPQFPHLTPRVRDLPFGVGCRFLELCRQQKGSSIQIAGSVNSSSSIRSSKARPLHDANKASGVHFMSPRPPRVTLSKASPNADFI